MFKKYKLSSKVVHRTSTDDFQAISAGHKVNPKDVFTGFCSIYYDILPLLNAGNTKWTRLLDLSLKIGFQDESVS